MHITNVELFKLAAINTPKHKLLPLMPVELMTESCDLNRLRSKYIILMTSVWKSYSKLVFGATCPVFGSFTPSGEILPSLELSDLCQVDVDLNHFDTQKFPKLDLNLVARDAGWGNQETVLQVLKLILQTIRYIFNKKWFQTIKLQFSSTRHLVLQKGHLVLEVLIPQQKMPKSPYSKS